MPRLASRYFSDTSVFLHKLELVQEIERLHTASVLHLAGVTGLLLCEACLQIKLPLDGLSFACHRNADYSEEGSVIEPGFQGIWAISSGLELAFRTRKSLDSATVCIREWVLQITGVSEALTVRGATYDILIHNSNGGAMTTTGCNWRNWQ